MKQNRSRRNKRKGIMWIRKPISEKKRTQKTKRTKRITKEKVKRRK